MMAQGESSGIFHVCRKHGSYNDAEQQLALMVTEHISLALANLKLQETLRHQAIRDPLTGLYNRRHMEESLEREIRRATRRNASFGVVMLDLDHFKRLNDTYGHAAGDAILRRMGEFLKDHVRGEDIACRYGGEEFALIILDASLEDVHRIADTIRQDVKQLDATYQNHHIGPLTVSLGVAAFPQHGTTIESLLQSADMALYRAKGEGRDRVVVIGQVFC
jgi:diguanylate cyclase (GGDEF)-like protein